MVGRDDAAADEKVNDDKRAIGLVLPAFPNGLGYPV
jgi:hypothetical protein